MKVIQIAFGFVFLCGFASSTLPDQVGSCSFMEFFCKGRRCNTVFYKALQKDPSAICSVKFRTMVECVQDVAYDCVRDRLSRSHSDAIISRSFEESEFCREGSFKVPDSSGASLPCTNTYLQKAPLCGKTFHEKFVADWSDPTLCSEQAKAKKCVRDLLDSECTVNSQDKQLLDLALGDYNPFCANNRDPGATGKDQCYGYTSKSDVISAKQFILLFLLGLYFVLV
ncbi:uncharacterized protein LOC144640336 isoform X1 [Oculina patagonica]